jgi:hypothetical protein
MGPTLIGQFSGVAMNLHELNELGCTHKKGGADNEENVKDTYPLNFLGGGFQGSPLASARCN